MKIIHLVLGKDYITNKNPLNEVQVSVITKGLQNNGRVIPDLVDPETERNNTQKRFYNVPSNTLTKQCTRDTYQKGTDCKRIRYTGKKGIR